MILVSPKPRKNWLGVRSLDFNAHKLLRVSTSDANLAKVRRNIDSQHIVFHAKSIGMDAQKGRKGIQRGDYQVNTARTRETEAKGEKAVVSCDACKYQ